MHHSIYHLWLVHGVASSSKARRLTNGYASSTTSSILGFLRSILLLLALQGCYFSFVVVFNHMTMMPCRNLRPHVCCSHMIKPLGAHWWLGICDVTLLQSLLMQPYWCPNFWSLPKDIELPRCSLRKNGCRARVICIINSWEYASYFMHFICAYIANIIILAS
jgi:hypothetical protein